MPTYEYRCPKGHEFERFQSMSEKPVAECPECGEASERLLSGGAGFIFKGEGFYITDSRSDEYKKAASSEKEGVAASDKGSGTSDRASPSDSSSSGSTAARKETPKSSNPPKSSDTA